MDLNVGYVLFEVGLGQDLQLSLTFINVVFFIYAFVSLFLLDGIYHIVIVLCVLLHKVVSLWGQSMVSADLGGDALVSISVLLVSHDEDQVESREQGVRHANILGGRQA